MYLRPIIEGESKYHKIDMLCDDCGITYTGRVGSAMDQITKAGKHNCRKCVSSRVGKQVHKDHPEIVLNAGKSNIGRKHTAEHLQKLRESLALAREKRKSLPRVTQKRARKPPEELLIVMIDLTCGMCGKEYRGRRKTALRQKEIHGHTLCNICKSVVGGRKTAAKMREVYRANWLGKNNPMNNPEIREKLAAGLRGKPLSDEHKKALCKPKSKVDKIREAANRPEERERRSKRMANWIAQNPDPAKGMFRLCKRDFVTTPLTPYPIFCRSGLEQFFVKNCTSSDKIKEVLSAENLVIGYEFHGKRRYLPDFLITLKTGKQFLVEIKCPMLLDDAQTKQKIKILHDYGCAHNIGTKVLSTNKEIQKWLSEL